MASDLWLRKISRCYPLHFCPIIILGKERAFPFLMLSAKQGNYWDFFITSLVWRGPWLGTEPRTSLTGCQHSTTRLSRRWYWCYIKLFILDIIGWKLDQLCHHRVCLYLAPWLEKLLWGLTLMPIFSVGSVQMMSTPQSSTLTAWKYEIKTRFIIQVNTICDQYKHTQNIVWQGLVSLSYYKLLSPNQCILFMPQHPKYSLTRLSFTCVLNNVIQSNKWIIHGFL